MRATRFLSASSYQSAQGKAFHFPNISILKSRDWTWAASARNLRSTFSYSQLRQSLTSRTMVRWYSKVEWDDWENKLIQVFLREDELRQTQFLFNVRRKLGIEDRYLSGSRGLFRLYCNRYHTQKLLDSSCQQVVRRNPHRNQTFRPASVRLPFLISVRPL